MATWASTIRTSSAPHLSNQQAVTAAERFYDAIDEAIASGKMETVQSLVTADFQFGADAQGIDGDWSELERQLETIHTIAPGSKVVVESVSPADDGTAVFVRLHATLGPASFLGLDVPPDVMTTFWGSVEELRDRVGARQRSPHRFRPSRDLRLAGRVCGRRPGAAPDHRGFTLLRIELAPGISVSTSSRDTTELVMGERRAVRRDDRIHERGGGIRRLSGREPCDVAAHRWPFARDPGRFTSHADQPGRHGCLTRRGVAAGRQSSSLWRLHRARRPANADKTSSSRTHGRGACTRDVSFQSHDVVGLGRVILAPNQAVEWRLGATSVLLSSENTRLDDPGWRAV